MPAALSLTAEALWLRVRAVFARARAAIGDAADIAAIRELTESLRRRIVARLAPLEAMARKLLLVEAARFAEEARVRAHIGGRRGAAPAQPRRPAHKRAFDLAQPETWPARFSLAPPRDPLLVANDRAPRIRALWDDAPAPARNIAPPPAADARAASSVFQLARRFEALRRVLEDPLPHARRLARVLVRAIRRFPEIARRYALAPARTGDYDADDPRLLLACIADAFAAAPRFSSA